MRDDECQIDREAMKTFVEALLEQHLRTSHTVVIALSEGFLATMLVLADRAGVEVTWPADRPKTSDNSSAVVRARSDASDTTSAHTRRNQLRAESRELSRFMAR